VIVSDSLYALMQVQAVPAAALLDQGGVVRRVWPYHGDENRSDLLSACRAEAPPPDTDQTAGRR